MAKERKVYQYNPIDLDKDIAVGITLPFGKPNGLFSQSYTTEEQAVSNLKNLLLTRKGERPFQPEFGSDVYSLLFENMSESLDEELKETLSKDIKFWLPYILIDNINIEIEHDRNYLRIELRFKVTEQGANTQIVLFIDADGAIIE